VPPRKKQPSGPKPVVATTYDDKRTNIPTADAQEFVAPDVEAPRKVRWQRDHSLDPQLVWKGKDFEADVLEGDAPPIYIQEKVDPRVLVENLRRTAAANEPEPELTLFDTFDGLDELDAVDFYRHDANWSNRMILGDSLNVMASLAERERLRGKVQMIYVDPPYGIKFGSNWQVSARKRDVKDGKVTDASRQVEQIKAFRDTWELGINSYLAYLRDRLLVARDLLTESGSCFVQIGDENVHLVRSLMDEVFGSENFVSQISFKTTSGAGSFAGGTTVLSSVSDFIIWYAKDLEQVKYRQLFREKVAGGQGGGQYTWVQRPDGARSRLRGSEPAEDERLMRPAPLTSQTTRVGQTTVFPVEVDGRSYTPKKGGWKTNVAGMSKLHFADRLQPVGQTLTYVRFLDDFPAFPFTNLWEDTVTSGFGDPKTYVVQTNAKVIERCMLMCTDPGDLVLDPTCGSGTTAHVAEQWGRRWITIDTSRVALGPGPSAVDGRQVPLLLAGRLGRGSPQGRPSHRHGAARQPALRRHPPRVRLRAGAAHHAEVHRQQPRHRRGNGPRSDRRSHQAPRRLRAALRQAVREQQQGAGDRPVHGREPVAPPVARVRRWPRRGRPEARRRAGGRRRRDWRRLHPDHPRQLGQGGHPERSAPRAHRARIRRALRRRVDQRRRHPQGTHLRRHPIRRLGTQPRRRHHKGDSSTADSEQDGAAAPPTKVGISLGPQYGTVSARWVKDAAREAIQAGDIDLLCILAFAFDPNVLGTSVDGAIVETDLDTDDFASVADQRQMGRVPVLLVRMNADLVMGEELKKTGRGQPVHGVRRARHRDHRGRRSAHRHPPRSGRVRPEHRRSPQSGHRSDRAVDDRQRLRRRELLRPPRLLHGWAGSVQEAEAMR
jgi:adenine-specific DNA-methyltransferase